MLNREQHQLIMARILRDIYAEPAIASLLGFKGGTCAYLFYGLPRFSVDLDFDLLKSNDDAMQKLVLETVRGILAKYGEIKDSRIKRYTIFFLLSYGGADHNIKLEINVRLLVPDLKTHYELKEYLGIAMLVSKKDYLFGSKLAALTLRSETAMRDIYDIWYFARNNWDINPDVLKAWTGKPVKAYLADCISIIERVKNSQLLQGLGEILSAKEKTWVKDHLKQEVIFLLNNYRSVLK